MKYIIKAQVKPYTRTRRGKMERVKSHSRQTPEGAIKYENGKIVSWEPKVYSHEKRFGEPYDTRQKEYAQPKEGAIELIGDKWMIARKVMVEVKRDKFLPEVQWTLPRPEDIPAVKARAQKRAETIVAGHQVKYKIAERMRAEEEETARKKMAEAKTGGGIKKVLREWGTALYRKKTKVGEPYSVKEHTQDEYKKYLASLDQDEKELSIEQWKLRLAIEEPKLGEPFEANKPLRHIELETKGMKKTKEWKIKEALRVNSSTEKPPKVLDASFKRDINKELHDISTKYHTEFPSLEIFDILRKRGIEVLQEDGTRFEGFFLGENAQTFFPIAPVGSKHSFFSKDIEFYTPFKNTALAMGWYKMPSGKYEMTTYVG